MPLVVTPGAVGGTPPPIQVAGQRQPLSLKWIDPDGTVWPWSDRSSGWVVTGITGLGSPPASAVSAALPGGGLLPQSYGAAPRSIVVGLVAFDDSGHDAFLDLLDRVATALWCERNGQPTPGTLVVARPGGSARQIDLMCTSGPEQAEENATVDGYRWTTPYALSFSSALDPLFSDATDTTAVFKAAPVSGGVPPMPPVVLSPSTVLGTTRITNQGRGDAYPIWEITGPGTPTLTNLTTGRSFGLDVDLGEGEVITVDTRPARQSAVDQDDEDRWGDLVKSSPRDLWVLPPGISDLDMQMIGAGETSQIRLSYRRRWLRA
jgi:hypothetical protein